MKFKLKVLIIHYKNLGLLNLVFYILQRIFKSKNKVIKVSVRGCQHPIYLRNSPSDTQIFTQLFLREELKVDLECYPKIIIDGGANIGLATVYLKNRYPDASIYSIEPDRSNFEILLMNTKRYKNIICYNNGIWNKSANLIIENKEAGSESFIVREVFDKEINGEDVIPAITIGNIVSENRIDSIGLLKLDIEGSEAMVFADNFKEWIEITDNILVEIHNWINKDANKIVMAALDEVYNYKMAGEYYFFTKSINHSNKSIKC
ncbi:MAG: FkbM family methyltransferase [Ginsengibacter sp.]